VLKDKIDQVDSSVTFGVNMSSFAVHNIKWIIIGLGIFIGNIITNVIVSFGNLSVLSSSGAKKHGYSSYEFRGVFNHGWLYLVDAWSGKPFFVFGLFKVLIIGLYNFKCVIYTTHMTFGSYLRQCREAKRQADPAYSVRQVAQRIGVEPAYLSKIERDEFPPPSEEKIRLLAKELDEDVDLLLAMAGKVSADLLAIILKRPKLMSDLLRQLKKMPDKAIVRIAREVRDGEW
jgi:transcriptional regulator with XRE-family HTH domain